MKVNRTAPFPEWTIFALFGVAIIAAIVGVAQILLPKWPPQAVCALEPCKEAREWIGSSFTFVLLLAGLYQFRRNQLWKRAEFVATEMKAFLSNEKVEFAMTMVDWTARRIDLLETGSKDPKEWVPVTRALQNRALLPHRLLSNADSYVALGPDPGHGSEVVTPHDDYDEKDSGLAGYSREHVAIRDAYDAFLDGLEGFANYRANGLVTTADLSPYLGYWIADISSRADNQAVNEWTFWLLSYVHFYRYTGVQRLFRLFGYDISLTGARFNFFMTKVENQKLALGVRTLLEKSDNPDIEESSTVQTYPYKSHSWSL